MYIFPTFLPGQFLIRERYGANPTNVSYNASVVKNYKATQQIACCVLEFFTFFKTQVSKKLTNSVPRFFNKKFPSVKKPALF
jgi:hypothetical protein